MHDTHSNCNPLPSRRALMTGALAGGFVLGFRLPVSAANEPEQPPDNPAGQFAPNAFIRIDHAGKTTLVMPQVEMGQGVYTAVAMILAEELDADFAAVTLEHAPPNDKLYGNPIVRHPGHRQFQFHPRVLEAAARGRRRRAGDAGAGRREAMAGRSGKLHRCRTARSPTARAGASRPTAIWSMPRAAFLCRRIRRSKIRRTSR